MSDLTLARAIHVVSIVIWMGGVAFVTLVLIPTIKQKAFKENQLEIFNAVENQFSLIAKVMVLLAGLSGFYLTYKLNAWHRFQEIQYFWMHGMVFVWLLFIIALFIVEPLFLKDHGRIIKQGHQIENLHKTQVLHLVILSLSLFVIFVSVLGAHGAFPKKW